LAEDGLTVMRFVWTSLALVGIFLLLWLFYRRELRRLAWALPLTYVLLFGWRLATRGLDDRALMVLFVAAGAVVIWALLWALVHLVGRHRQRRRRAAGSPGPTSGRGAGRPPGGDHERPGGAVRP
jgi:hypothetical protein